MKAYRRFGVLPLTRCGATNHSKMDEAGLLRMHIHIGVAERGRAVPLLPGEQFDTKLLVFDEEL
jgi:hypothetical protein